MPPRPADSLAEGLDRALKRAALGPATELERLSGGANMESWRFRSGADLYVLRRAPSADLMAGRPMDHPAEARLIGAARAGGVLAPEVVADLLPEDGIGSGYVMRAMAGTPEPGAILAASEPGPLAGDLVRELAAIHGLATENLPAPVMDTGASLAELKRRFLEYGGDRPIAALAIRWLEDNLPPPVTPRLCHGDFRLGNVLVEVDGPNAGRLAGVIDWELAHLGDPHEDLAFGCLTVWRFSRPDRPGFGLVTLDELFAAYEAAGGQPVDRQRFRFWTVYRTLWWALGCLQMGGYWRDGHDRSIERVVVAHRTSEQELDLLILLEEEAPEAERQRPVPPPNPPVPTGTGEPDAREVLQAVSEWLASDIKPLVSGRDKFNLAVARNALGIAAREITQRPAFSDPDLAADLLAGKADLATPGLLARLRRMALDKLAADVPKYPALALARTRWEGP